MHSNWVFVLYIWIWCVFPPGSLSSNKKLKGIWCGLTISGCSAIPKHLFFFFFFLILHGQGIWSVSLQRCWPWKCWNLLYFLTWLFHYYMIAGKKNRKGSLHLLIQLTRRLRKRKEDRRHADMVISLIFFFFVSYRGRRVIWYLAHISQNQNYLNCGPTEPKDGIDWMILSIQIAGRICLVNWL